MHIGSSDYPPQLVHLIRGVFLEPFFVTFDRPEIKTATRMAF
jgi:hypothetical protein